MSAFIVAKGEGWQGLYIDGRLTVEEHNISVERALEHAFNYGPVTSLRVVYPDENWLDDRGSLPEEFCDVVF
jgi:hypothetical protein